jgi:hypothetical protein
MRQPTLKLHVICFCIIMPLMTSCTMTHKPSVPDAPDPRFAIGDLIFADDFKTGLSNWTVELEQGGSVETINGALDIDVPAGCTVWLKRPLDGPLMIEYDATVIRAGGPNDRVSDLNCFWMATDARSPDDLFATHRSGKFSDYDQLLGYYVGLGGNGNSTTRFRRYIGQQNNRPLLPEHDLRDPPHMIAPNVSQKLRLVADGNLIQFYRDGKPLFEMRDPNPYTRGHFAFRTVSNHMRISQFRVYRLRPTAG